VLEDALPRKSEYRRFRVRDVPGNDDYAAMEEVLTRRLRALLAARAERDAGTSAPGSRARRFAYPPQLILLDGGKGQLGVGVRVLEQLGLTDEIPVAALAKSFEEVFVPGRPEPVPVPRGSEALFLLQRVRDEAHRFAVTYHRDLRGKRMTRSALEGIPGLGPTRRTRLLRQFGSVRAVRAASLAQLEALPWLPAPVAASVHARLHEVAPRGRPEAGPVGAATDGATVPAGPSGETTAPGGAHPPAVPRLQPGLGQDGNR